MAQKASTAKVGTLDELLEGVDAERAAIVRRLCAMIRAIDPKTVETVRLGDGAASYGVGPKKMTEGYAYVMPQRAHANLGFYQGARLPDPEGRLEGTGKGLRHVKVHSLVEADAPALRALVQAAIALRRS